MEESIRPYRREVPNDIIHFDLKNLLGQTNAHTLLVSDALFKSFDIFPLLRSLNLKVNFETRCDVLNPNITLEFKQLTSFSMTKKPNLSRFAVLTSSLRICLLIWVSMA